MKQRGYTIKFADGRLSVEHRASIRPRTIVALSAAYVCYCLLPHVRHVLLDTYSQRDPILACFALFFLLIPPLCFWTWFFFVSGEVLRCDKRNMQIAKRRTWGRWHRFHCTSPEVQHLQYVWRGRPKGRSYGVLTFQYGGCTFDILEELSQSQVDEVLNACASLGLNVVPFPSGLVPSGHDAAMLKDIEERGWFVNPLEPANDKPK